MAVDPLQPEVAALPIEKRLLSGEDLGKSTQKSKKKKEVSKDPSAANAAREEMESLLIEPAVPKKPAPTASKAPEKQAPHATKTPRVPLRFLIDRK